MSGTRRTPNINVRRPQSIDYVEQQQFHDVNVGLCEIQGNRGDQEDAIIANAHDVAQLSQMSDVDIRAGFTQTFDTIQASYGDIDSIGTTCCMNTAWLDPATNKVTAWTANLGDSTAFLVVLNDRNEFVSAELLNDLHSADENKELERLGNTVLKDEQGKTLRIQDDALGEERDKTAKDTVAVDRGVARIITFVTPPLSPAQLRQQARLAAEGKRTTPRLQKPPERYGLAVTRGFGDRQFEASGYSHEVDVSKKELRLLPGQKAFIVVACDGLTEVNLNAEGIGKVISQQLKSNSSVTEATIAEALVNQAYQNGSDDNISAAIFRVNKTPTSVTVCDGHGGKKKAWDKKSGYDNAGALAKKIGEQFYQTLTLTLAKVNQNKNKKQYAKSSTSTINPVLASEPEWASAKPTKKTPKVTSQWQSAQPQKKNRRTVPVAEAAPKWTAAQPQKPVWKSANSSHKSPLKQGMFSEPAKKPASSTSHEDHVSTQGKGRGRKG